MTPLYIIITALSMAVSYDAINKLRFKPFNCLMCLTGWISLIIAACAGYGLYSGLFFFVGCFAGANYELFRGRWL